MNTVESKYRNPDKYIKELKRQLQRSRSSRDVVRRDLVRERGNPWFGWEDGVIKSVELSSSEASRASLGQGILITGSIVGYKRTQSDPREESVEIELKRVNLIERKPY